jgi:SAM-dependent methyltransferase
MPKIERLDTTKHYKTKNSRGFMHPISEIGKKFVLFSSTAKSSVVDMGCAYGNTTIAALDAGAKAVIACDMEQEHLDALHNQLEGTPVATSLTTKQGVFPNGFYFAANSLEAIHASHILEYLNGDEVEQGLANCFRWLRPGGKLFILTYTIYILELANDKFQTEYDERIKAKVKWPGYLEDFDKFCDSADQGQTSGEPKDNKDKIDADDSPFPSALHMYDLPILKRYLETLGFIIEHADYLDGRSNGAVKETFHDGREYVGVIARKPKAKA